MPKLEFSTDVVDTDCILPCIASKYFHILDVRIVQVFLIERGHFFDKLDTSTRPESEAVRHKSQFLEDGDGDCDVNIPILFVAVANDAG